MDDTLFDDVAREFTARAITRRHGLKLLLVGVGGAMLSRPFGRWGTTAAWAKGPAARAAAATCPTVILYEGSCQFLVDNNRACCDPNGLAHTPRPRPHRAPVNGAAGAPTVPAQGSVHVLGPSDDVLIDATADAQAKRVPCERPVRHCVADRYTPLFTCDKCCQTARANGCNDGDLWIAAPGGSFSYALCGQQYTICSGGKKVQAPVRDKSITAGSYEVSPGVIQALGVAAGSFNGRIYPPGTPQTTIDNDLCCSDDCDADGDPGDPSESSEC